MSGLPKRVRLTEVGPRDGLQNESDFVPTDVKVAFVRALLAAGLRDIEVSSFVRHDLVPQLRDAAGVFQELGIPPEGVTYGALVPNERGMQGALAAGVGKVAVFTAASESFARANVNASIAESLARFWPAAETAKREGIKLRGYVSCAVACPFEGPIRPEAVLDVCRRLLELGCEELSVGDTIGAGTPAEVGRLLDVLLAEIDPERIVLHFHDTRGMAVANVMEGLRHGITAYDASAAGLGGCPFAPGSSGNVATDDLVFLFDRLGIEHGVEPGVLHVAGEVVAPHIGHPLVSRVWQAPDLIDPVASEHPSDRP